MAVGVSHCAFATRTVLLEAKNTQKRKKRLGGPRGGGRRGKAKHESMIDEDEQSKKRNSKSQGLREPRKLRKRLIEVKRPPSPTKGQQQDQFLPPLRVCSVEVDDREWWEQEGNDNPYGARLWPSALAISEFPVDLSCMGAGDSKQETPRLEGYEILELGCGAGLVSIVAAECGANVVASDLSPLAIKLCRIGWKETQKLRADEELAKKRKREQKEKLQQFRRLSRGVAANDATGQRPSLRKYDDRSLIRDKAEEKKPMVAKKSGTLETSILDLFSNKRLPIVATNEESSSESPYPPKIVIATTMMYEPGLATILAQRALEACRCGAWVVIGDDDTGEREGGRTLFVSELDRLEKQEEIFFPRIWTDTKVKSKALQWNEKRVQILHLNAPDNIQDLLKNYLQ